MDAFHFDNYTTYSDASTPRTPSPRTSVSSDDGLHYHSPSATNYKQPLDIAIAPTIFDPHTEDGILPDAHAIKPPHIWSQSPYQPSFPQPPSSRASLLEELYDHDIPDQHMPSDIYPHQDQQPYQVNSWSTVPQSAHTEPVNPPMRHPHDIAMTRRATFPYVRHDGRESLPYPSQPFMSADMHPSYAPRPATAIYGEPLPMDGMSHYEEPFAHSVHMGYDHIDTIKTEDVPVIVPSQTGFCRPPSTGMHGLPCLSPHAGLLVQHTDDAASKETQYLRRRCFNCHTTEPPSWRRSTLNPGKIVCNKCGLYERTHLRPRPLRFDELRAGTKTRKQPKVGGSPKGKLQPVVKKEGEEQHIIQRHPSVSSSTGSVHSAPAGGSTSDWDDSVSIASSGSVPPSSYSSPSVSTFSIPRDPNSQSPPLAPRDGGIRLPNAPLTDIASLSRSPSQRPSAPPTPRKSATAPAQFYDRTDYYCRGGQMVVPVDVQQQQPSIPEVTGWQSVPLSDLTPSKAIKSRSNSLRKTIVA